MTDHKHESLSESRRTVVYAIVAGLSITLGVYTYLSNQPKPMKEFEKVGQEFYPEFTKTDDATSLFVAKYYENEGEVKTFEVEQEDGQWRIPSHYNYPADATEQLAKTAASIMGIRREALISRSAADHIELGVVDPESEDISDRKGRGERITIKNGNNVLADYIIGKEYKGEKGVFYVRAPQEKETYVAHIKVDLSTKFSDWIDTDLLKIDRNKLVEILVRKYSIDEEKQELSNYEATELKREKFGTPWELVGLDEKTEEVNHDAVKDLASALVDLKILGVRPKPRGLTPALTLSEDARNPIVQIAMQSDLAAKGFQLVQNENGKLSLVAQEGSFFTKTSDGIDYELHFGNIFTGDLSAIEIGKSNEGEGAPAEDSSNGETEDGQPAEAEAEDDVAGEQDDETQTSRYLFLKVSFDPSVLGPEPAAPEAPQDPGPFDPNAPLIAPRPGESLMSPQEKYQQDLQLFEFAQKQFEQQQKTYDEKLEAGRKQAAELSDRLGAWYYVVPAENVDALRVSRADLVQPAGTDAAKKAQQQQQQQPGGAGSPQLPFTPDQLKLPRQN